MPGATIHPKLLIRLCACASGCSVCVCVCACCVCVFVCVSCHPILQLVVIHFGRLELITRVGRKEG